jgi:two-component system sensor histidine kinase/response regulator
VIAMTANVMTSDRDACLAAGMNDHIGKPIDLSDLVRVLNQHTRLASVSVSAVASIEPPAHRETQQPIDDVDVDGALERLGGNTSLYAKVLNSYLDDLVNQPDQLEALLQKGDLHGAHRLLHTLKGLSATVGAGAMAGVAKAMELTVIGIDTVHPSPAFLTHFRESVTATQCALKAVADRFTPAESPAAAPAKPLDTTQLQTDLAVLHALLQHSDMQALEVHAQLRKDHAGGSVDLEALNSAMNKLDFEKSMVECDNLLQNPRRPTDHD